MTSPRIRTIAAVLGAALLPTATACGGSGDSRIVCFGAHEFRGRIEWFYYLPSGCGLQSFGDSGDSPLGA